MKMVTDLKPCRHVQFLGPVFAPPNNYLLIIANWFSSVNIGNARLYNLEKDLGLVGNQFQIAVSIFFVTCESHNCLDPKICK